MSNRTLFAGVDFGGTKIRTAVVNRAGDVLGDVVEKPTRAQRPPAEILRDIVQTVTDAATAAGVRVVQLSGLGVGSPGPLDLTNGVVLSPPNLPTMWNFPLKDTLAEQLQLPVHMNNDGNCFVLGEATFGAAREMQIVAGVTLGTGLGCGVVVNGRILEGATGTAAEIWCSPYCDGTFEDYGAARGLVRCYRDLTGVSIDGAEIHRRAQAGEDAALQAWRKYGEHLGTILSHLVNVLDPDALVVGGSVAAGWDFFYQPALGALRKNINPRPREHVRLLRTSLGELSGALGAAALALSESKTSG